MGTGVVKLLNNWLRRKNLVIKDYDEYQEVMSVVRYNWIKKYNIKTVLDIGASIGEYAVKLRGIFPDTVIHSFEPNPESFAILANVAAADEKHFIHNIALSDSKGPVPFNLNQYAGSSSILHMTPLHKETYPITAHSKEIIVQAIPLDAVFPTLSAEGPVYMKIDVQGAESKVLSGGVETLTKTKLVCIETSFVELYESQWLFDELYQFMRMHKFSLCDIDATTHSVKDGSLLQADLIFCNTLI